MELTCDFGLGSDFDLVGDLVGLVTGLGCAVGCTEGCAVGDTGGTGQTALLTE